MCETCKPPVASLRARNPHRSFHSQSQRAQRDDAKLAVRRIRQNSTESDRIQQDATKTRARAHARAKQPLSVSIPRGASRNVRDMQTAERVAPCPQPSPVIPLPIAARPKRRCQTRRQEDPTKSDRKRQNTTQYYENSCPPAREATAFRFSFPSARVATWAQRIRRVSHRSELPPPCRHANRPNRTPFSQLVACNAHVCYYFPSIGERRQT